MAQGLVQPTTAGTFRGGLDLTHASGVYLGQWSPSVGLLDGSQLELNSYVGYAQPRLDDSLGYELGVIRYSFPSCRPRTARSTTPASTWAAAGCGALSSSLGRTDSTLFLDLGALRPFDVGVRLKYASHTLDSPLYYPGGSVRVFNDWSLNLSRRLLGMQLDLSYTDTSLRGAQWRLFRAEHLLRRVHDVQGRTLVLLASPTSAGAIPVESAAAHCRPPAGRPLRRSRRAARGCHPETARSPAPARWPCP